MRTIIYACVFLTFVSCRQSDNDINTDKQKSKSDTTDIPRLTLTANGDSIKVIVRTNKYQNIDIYFGYDSTRAVNGKSPKYLFQDAKTTTIIKADTQMFEEPNILTGVFKCWDSTAKYYDWYPFRLRTDNNYR